MGDDGSQRSSLSKVKGILKRCRPPRYYPVLTALSWTDKGPAVSFEIERRILEGAPLMVARFGTSEFEVLQHYWYLQCTPLWKKASNFLFYREKFWWTEEPAKGLCNNAGFFPYSAANVERFSELMVQAMGQVDILGSWVPGETLYRDQLHRAYVCPLADLEPYYHPQPWSRALAGKRVLVVNPFAETIKQQYDQHRQALFADPDVLPSFDLLVYKAVQSIAGETAGFPDWFAALDKMTNDISSLDFDVAIIGCGAYGFPLAARVKAMGRQAIHLGGATQILFGVKGKRWEAMPEVSKFFNPLWTRPQDSDRPKNADRVEDGCYW